MKQFAEKWANVLKVADQPEANEEKWIKNAVLWMKKKWRKRSRRRRRRRMKKKEANLTRGTPAAGSVRVSWRSGKGSGQENHRNDARGDI